MARGDGALGVPKAEDLGSAKQGTIRLPGAALAKSG